MAGVERVSCVEEETGEEAKSLALTKEEACFHDGARIGEATPNDTFNSYSKAAGLSGAHNARVEKAALFLAEQASSLEDKVRHRSEEFATELLFESET